MTHLAVLASLATSTGVAAWAGEESAENRGPEILVDIRVTTTDSQSSEAYSAATRYIVHSGELPADMQDSAFACTPFLPSSLAPDSAKSRSVTQGRILFECVIREHGKVVASPSAVTLDGRTAVLRISAGGTPRTYEIELNATTSEERIAEAMKAGDKR